MDTQAYHHWPAQLSQLSVQQKSTLNQALQKLQTTQMLDCPPSLRGCPHCQAGAKQLASWGWSRRLRHYHCHTCRRTCTAFSATGLAYLHCPEPQKDYTRGLIDGFSVHKAAKACGRSKNTAALWRHRFLAAAVEHHAPMRQGN